MMKYLTVEEIQDILKVTPRTVYNYIYDGKIKAIKVGKYWRVAEQDFQEFMNSLQENEK